VCLCVCVCVCFLSLSIPLPPPHSLRDGQITKEGLAVFCKVLAGNSYLQTLILGGNNLTDEGAQMLAAAMQSDTTALRTLK
jgi:hypothetical protein